MLNCINEALTSFIAANICTQRDYKFLIAPPLLVAFIELSKVGCPAAKRKPQLILLVSLCALVGAAMRFILVMECGLYFPPAGAMAVLAFFIASTVLSILFSFTVRRAAQGSFYIVA